MVEKAEVPRQRFRQQKLNPLVCSEGFKYFGIAVIAVLVLGHAREYDSRDSHVGVSSSVEYRCNPP